MATEADLARQVFVQARQLAGTTISRDVGFVTKEMFKRHFGMEVLAVYDLMRFGILPCESREGGIMGLKEIPEESPFENVQIFATQSGQHVQQLLGPGGTFRKKQPTDRHTVAVNSMMSKRPKALYGLTGFAVRSTDINKNCPTHQCGAGFCK